MIKRDGRNVGAWALSDIYEGLHAQVHMLIRPWALRDVLCSPVIAEAIAASFLGYNLIKLKAECLDKQHGAQRLLKSYGFVKRGILRNETKHKGELADLKLYELNKDYWQHKWLRSRHELWGA